MKKLFLAIILSFFSFKSVLAETSYDYFQSKLGSMDLSIICTNVNGMKRDYSFKTINGKTFYFEYLEDEKFYGPARSTVKIFKRRFDNQDIDIYMIFAPLMPDYGPGKPGLSLGVFLFGIQNKILELGYFVKDKDFSMYDEFISLNWVGNEYDEKIHEWSEKAYTIISERLGFGEPFELIDLESIDENGLIKDEEGFFITQNQCKKRK